MPVGQTVTSNKILMIVKSFNSFLYDFFYLFVLLYCEILELRAEQEVKAFHKLLII